MQQEKVSSKAEKTKQYIIAQVAPLFNQKGYAATSLQDITRATSLTKGAIYGNFDNKESLAIAAFYKTVNDVLKTIDTHLKQSSSPLQKLYLILDFYKNYYRFCAPIGGCPILNIGIDAKNQNTILIHEVQKVILKLQNNIASLVKEGQEKKEIKSSVSAVAFSRLMYARIQGALFMSQTMKDEHYLIETLRELEKILNTQIKK